MNLIPNQNKKSMSYWCTWATQNFVAKKDCNKKFPPETCKTMMMGAEGAKLARMMLNEELIFGEGGYASQFEDVRRDLYFVLDDGWDVDYGINPDVNKARFGSLEMSEERFPSTKGHTPAQRLKIINNKVKEYGWKGLGIWVAAQRCAEDYTTPFSELDIPYWKERILWSREAGVEYWKVDWGAQANNNDFRRTLTELGHKYYPDLIIEHAACMSAVNAIEHSDVSKIGRFAGQENKLAFCKNVVEYAYVFRSYDVLSPLAIPTTIDRIVNILPMANGYINGEDELYINATLGCACGVMRSHFFKDEPVDFDDTSGLRLDEVTAALRWQRVAPPFAGTELSCSDEVLFDSHFFDVGSTWCGLVLGKHVKQGAPAVVARNLSADSIRVIGDFKPYVAASLAPNNVYSVGIFPRFVDGARRYPDAIVECDIPFGVDTIGALGVGCNLRIKLPQTPKKVYVQSLLADEAVELFEGIEKNDITITNALACRIFGGTDLSAPALVFRILY